MNILRTAIIEDDYLAQVFDVKQVPVAPTDGLIYIELTHPKLKMQFIIDIDLDTGTLTKVNDVRIKYNPSHTFENMNEFYVLLKSVLEQTGLA